MWKLNWALCPTRALITVNDVIHDCIHRCFKTPWQTAVGCPKYEATGTYHRLYWGPGSWYVYGLPLARIFCTFANPCQALVIPAIWWSGQSACRCQATSEIFFLLGRWCLSRHVLRLLSDSPIQVLSQSTPTSPPHHLVYAATFILFLDGIFWMTHQWC